MATTKKAKPVKKARRASKAKTVKKTGLTLLNFKISKTAKQVMEARARKFTKGNISAWVRYAATHATPTAKDLKALRQTA